MQFVTKLKKNTPEAETSFTVKYGVKGVKNRLVEMKKNMEKKSMGISFVIFELSILRNRNHSDVWGILRKSIGISRILEVSDSGK
jgi:hypothetical protein